MRSRCGHELDECGLASPVVAHETDDLVVGDLEVDVPQHLDFTEGLADAHHFDESG